MVKGERIRGNGVNTGNRGNIIDKGERKINFKRRFSHLTSYYHLAKATFEFRRFVKFCAVGLSGVFINMGLLFMLTEYFGLFYLVSSAIAVESSILSNFTWNNIWTFKDREKNRSKLHILSRMVKFNITMLIGLAINVSILYALTEFLEIPYLISNLGGIAVAVLWNFLGSERWIWKANEAG